MALQDLPDTDSPKPWKICSIRWACSRVCSRWRLNRPADDCHTLHDIVTSGAGSLGAAAAPYAGTLAGTRAGGAGRR